MFSDANWKGLIVRHALNFIASHGSLSPRHARSGAVGSCGRRVPISFTRAASVSAITMECCSHGRKARAWRNRKATGSRI